MLALWCLTRTLTAAFYALHMLGQSLCAWLPGWEN